jgi:hypothetical protein
MLAAKRAASGTDAMFARSGRRWYGSRGSAPMLWFARRPAPRAWLLHEFTLARPVGCGPDHLFMRKYHLFESGRWPLGVLRGAFHLL